MKPDLSVKIGKLTLNNPVMVASGTFGYGEEYDGIVELNKLGAIIVKAVTLKPTLGNPQPRIAEVTAGMLNSIGLQNEGVDYFIEKKIPIIREYGVPIIVNIAGTTVKEYKELVQRLDQIPEVSGFEINISCPNVKEGGMQFGTDPKWTSTVVKNVKSVTGKTVITKLSPNVTDIVTIAEAAEDGGSDAVSLVNTFKAMAINVETRKPVLATITGGLSGPCIKPIALRMVWEVANKLDIPVVGIGGIMNTNDALEFIIAGASAVEIGTASFVNPRTATNVVIGIEDYLKKNNVPNVRLITGSVNSK
jgi:dihydroorotate dehydrogenase (NAD+) catalytic subunit